MPRNGLTYDDVAAAADIIYAEKLAAAEYPDAALPTTREVLQRLGRGSMSTIAQHMAKWRQARQEGSLADGNVLADAMSDIKRRLLQIDAHARSEMGVLVAMGQAEVSDLATAGLEVEEERDDLQMKLDAVASDRDTLAATAKEQAWQIERLRAEIVAKGQSEDRYRREAADASARIETETAKRAEEAAGNKQVTAALHDETHARIEAEQKAAALTDALRFAQDQITEARRMGQEQLTDTRREIDRLISEVERERQEKARERERADLYQKAEAELRADMAALRGQIPLPQNRPDANAEKRPLKASQSDRGKKTVERQDDEEPPRS